MQSAEAGPRSTANMHDWAVSSFYLDDDGNAVMQYEAPKEENTHYLRICGDKVEIVDSFTFKTTPDQVRAGYRGGRGRGSYTRGNYSRGMKSLVGPSYSRPTEKQKLTICPHCKKSGHPAYLCESFKALDVKARFASVKENRLCMRCLNQNHTYRDCTMRFVCDIDGCGKPHHRLLHTKEISRSIYRQYFMQGMDDELSSEDENQQGQY